MPKGSTYTFEVTATVGNRSGSASLSITVIDSPLVAIIDKASGSVTKALDLHLSGKNSYDPDDPSSVLSYKWTCKVCTDENSVDLIIPKDKLTVGDTFEITLEVSQGDRTASDSISLSIRNAGDVSLAYIKNRSRVNYHCLLYTSPSPRDS